MRALQCTLISRATNDQKCKLFSSQFVGNFSRSPSKGQSPSYGLLPAGSTNFEDTKYYDRIKLCTEYNQNHKQCDTLCSRCTKSIHIYTTHGQSNQILTSNFHKFQLVKVNLICAYQMILVVQCRELSPPAPLYGTSFEYEHPNEVHSRHNLWLSALVRQVRKPLHSRQKKMVDWVSNTIYFQVRRMENWTHF